MKSYVPITSTHAMLTRYSAIKACAYKRGKSLKRRTRADTVTFATETIKNCLSMPGVRTMVLRA